MLSFLILPGLTALVVPLMWIVPRAEMKTFYMVALIPLVLGAVILFWCVRDFLVTGRGTLAPWDPPKNLVETGLYRYSRNPMYVGVLLILIGWAMGYRSTALWIYAGAMAVMFHLRVVLGEEPWLARTHGEAFSRYKKRVGRWI